MEQQLRSRFETSMETKILVGLLSKCEEDEVISYETMNKAIEGNVQKTQHGMLASARRIVLRDNIIVFETLRCVGIRRVPNERIPTLGAETLSRVRNAARKAAKKMSAVDFDQLSNQSKLTYLTNQSFMGVLMSLTKEKTIKKIEEKVRKASDLLPPNAFLKLENLEKMG